MASYTYGGSSSGAQGSVSYTIISGTDNSEFLTGDFQSNYLKAKNGNDILVGGSGFDLLEGSGGGDRFTFETDKGYDTVTGYNYSQGDRILLPSGINFSQLSFDYNITASSYLGTGTISGLNIIYNGAVWMRLEGATASATNPFSIGNFTYNSDVNALPSQWGTIV
jgi:Ca2+-binding RTX toxin-like protein